MSTLNNLGTLYGDRGGHRRALDYYQRALQLAEDAGDEAQRARTLTSMSVEYVRLGEADRVIGWLEYALAVHERTGDRGWQATALGALGLAHDELGDAHRALEHHVRSLAIRRAIGDRTGQTLTLTNMAEVHAESDRLAEAERLLRRAITIEERINAGRLADHRQRLQQIQEERRRHARTPDGDHGSAASTPRGN